MYRLARSIDCIIISLIKANRIFRTNTFIYSRLLTLLGYIGYLVKLSKIQNGIPIAYR